MSDTVIDLLKKQRKYQLEQKMLLEDFPHPEMVFTSSTGNYKDRSQLNETFKNHLKKTEFNFMTLHCLRHSNATLLLNNGVDIKMLSGRLNEAASVRLNGAV